MAEHSSAINPGFNDIQAFIDKWKASGGAERANYQLFLAELCTVLGVPQPDPTVPDDSANAYVFERSVTFHHGDGTTSAGFLDLYKRGHFVLEAKQGTEQREKEQALSSAHKAKKKARKKGMAVRDTPAWDGAMLRARGQAEQYARALPVEEGRPPFLVVVDVGHSIELFSEFTCTGATYVPFPDARNHRIKLEELAKPEVRETLRLVWAAPHELDPTRRSARITKEIADRLGQLARSLEASGHDVATVAGFLMRSLFTMFAEDVGLLPERSFTDFLAELKKSPDSFAPMVEELWGKMQAGGFSVALRQQVKRFNGGLFEDATALVLTEDQLELLLEAAQADWRDVEPTIFGTLLERALDPHERHKLGAHYTPRAYVERLVLPTVVEPLREEWGAVQAAAVTLDGQGDRDKAIAELDGFHRRLCEVRVLDPSCGSGNFLYVTLEHLKRLEGEVLEAMHDLKGESQTLLDIQGHTVDPHQLLGIEINPRATAIAEMVLWIGYLQWHFRTRGNVSPPEPILRNFHNIECRDAVLDWDDTEPMLDADGNAITRWDGRTTKTHPTTGKEVPDESAQIPLVRYLNPRRAEWPEADFVVGNPPFIGNSRMRAALGDGYTEALRKAHDDVSESVDFVMYWWNHAAALAREGKLRRFGLITTNSLRQKFARRVLENHLNAKNPLSLVFAIPDHPWVDSGDGADVRIAMTVAAPGTFPGSLREVVEEVSGHGEGHEVLLSEKIGKIEANVAIGPNLGSLVRLEANNSLSSEGVKPHGMGFVVTPAEAKELGLGRVEGLEHHIRHYRNGRDLNQRNRGVMIIDLQGLTSDEVRQRFPEVYQWVVERVKPERDQNREPYRRENWWVFGRKHTELRRALASLPRYVATVKTTKHRVFSLLDRAILPDSKIIAIALDDAYMMGVLSSRVHMAWALVTGGRHGVGNDLTYVKSLSFDAFPFPDCTDAQKATIRKVAEELDAHRKRQLGLHENLTLTKMYNVLEKERAGTELIKAERTIHEQGLVSILRQLHDELGTAVADAYGWQVDLADEEILERLVALNKERAAEEARGLVRWLRPEYQNPEGHSAEQLTVDVGTGKKAATKKVAKKPWPTTLPEQAQAVHSALKVRFLPATTEEIAKTFTRAPRAQVAALLDTLASLGQAIRVGEDRYGVG